MFRTMNQEPADITLPKLFNEQECRANVQLFPRLYESYISLCTYPYQQVVFEQYNPH